MRMQTSNIAAKVWAAALAALLTPILLALLAKLGPEIPLPVDSNDLIQTIIIGAITGAVTLVTGYLKRPDSLDRVTVDLKP